MLEANRSCIHMRQHTSEYVELVQGRQAEGHAAFGSLQEYFGARRYS
jgi:hypothetical protein